MAVKIRLKRMGSKKRPFYRIIAADSRMPRDGRFIETLGYYNPILNPAEIHIDEELVFKWFERGAVPTTSTASLLRQVGCLQKWKLMKQGITGDALQTRVEAIKAQRLAARDRREKKRQATLSAKATAKAATAAEAAEAGETAAAKTKAEAPAETVKVQEPAPAEKKTAEAGETAAAKTKAEPPAEPAKVQEPAPAEEKAVEADETAAAKTKAEPPSETAKVQEPAPAKEKAVEAEPAPDEKVTEAEADAAPVDTGAGSEGETHADEPPAEEPKKS
ncbi:MAG: 30S ribosomal protein S16 [Candidatus Krumholzibacteria bacterium]